MTKTKNKTFSNVRFFSILVFIATLLMGVGYASISSITLDLNGKLVANVQKKVFITDIVFNKSNNANVEDSDIINAFGTNLNSNIVLSDIYNDSSITYTITIKNNTDEDHIYKGVFYGNDVNFYSNNNITFDLEGLKMDYILEKGKFISFNITFKYANGVVPSSDINTLKSYLNFRFEPTSLYTLLPGTEFNYLIKTGTYATADKLKDNYNSSDSSAGINDDSIKKIIFGKNIDYSDHVSDVSPIAVDLDKAGTINMYRVLDSNNKYNIYILSETGKFFSNTNCSWMFEKLTHLSEIVNLSSVNTSYSVNMAYMFFKASNVCELDLSGFNTLNVSNMSRMFYSCSLLKSLDLSSFITPKLTTISEMFYECASLEVLDVSNFITNNVTSMYRMFHGCTSLLRLDLSNFNTSKVKQMGGVFTDCKSLIELDISNFDTSNVESMGWMFRNLHELVELDVSHFNTESVTNMTYMFGGCRKLTSLDVSGFVTSKVTDMSYMFYDMELITSLDLSNFDTSNVEKMNLMFNSLDSITKLDLSSFKTPKLYNTESMFSVCTKLTEINFSNAYFGGVTKYNNMFYGLKQPNVIVASNQISWFDGKFTTIVIKDVNSL